MSSNKKPAEKIVTKRTDAFCRAVEKPGAPIVIYNRPEKYNELSKGEIRESFRSWAWTQRRYHHPGLVHTRSDAVSIHAAELPPTTRHYLLELKSIFERLSGLGFLNSDIYVVQSSEGMMGRAGKKRVSPVLMVHWTAAGNGALTAEQREIIPEAALGFFPANANIPLHRYNRDSHSSVSVIVVPAAFLRPQF
jgi:hypothetical protein